MFYDYFDIGIGKAEAPKYHEKLLELKENFTFEQFVYVGINPCYRTICNWLDIQKSLNLGP